MDPLEIEIIFGDFFILTLNKTNLLLTGVFCYGLTDILVLYSSRFEAPVQRAS